MIIIGAGLTGLLAGVIFPNARIIERDSEEDYQPHRALLRFRSSRVGETVGIDFRKVRVHKAIFDGMTFAAPTPQNANWYSKKVTGQLLSRSIWDLAPVDRYVAPSNFQLQLLSYLRHRIEFGRTPTGIDQGGGAPILSTMPMPALIEECPHILPAGGPTLRFTRSPVTVWRYAIDGADVHQTIYYPLPEHQVYRASITGDTLIVETIGNEGPSDQEMDMVLDSFGIAAADIVPLENSRREFGKIVPVDDPSRRTIIINATRMHGIYSAGRFAIWKNVLMDDVLDDLFIIKRLINSGDYSRALHNAKGERV